jgi:hypothetical protein
MTTTRKTPLLKEYIVIRVSQQTKDLLAYTAKQYGMFPTQLGRHLIEKELPHIQKNRFFEYFA